MGDKKIYYEFQAPTGLSDKILKEIKELKFSKNVYNFYSHFLFGSNKENIGYFNIDLFNFIESCLSNIKKDFFSDNINFHIVSCWANRSTTGQKHHRHSHINSLLSGIFYLSTHETGETVFFQPNPWLVFERLQIFQLSKSPELIDYTYEVKPQKGKLIIFPSQIEHCVKENKEAEDRYTVAFNIFISGVLSKSTSAYLRLKANKFYI